MEAAQKAAWSITSAELHQIVSHLAGPEFHGRATGSPDFQKVAHWIAQEFQQMGLEPVVGDTSYFQRFSIGRNEIASDMACELVVLFRTKSGRDTLRVSYRPGEDFIPAGFSGVADICAPVVFAGYGLEATDKGYNDYKGLRVKDKLVMVLSGGPPLKGVKWKREETRAIVKARLAQSKGAAGLVMVWGPHGTISSKRLEGFPVVFISQKVANDLLTGTGQTIQKLRKRIKETQRPKTLALKHRLHLRVTGVYHPKTPAMNILGAVRGSDPLLREQWIVVGAHADHLGKIGPVTHWGANDNASGTTVMMELAEAFATMEVKPRRSLLFMAFAGEEMGLKGSTYYVEHPLIPLENTVAMINLDMVGSGRKGVMVVCGQTFPKFFQLFEAYNNRFIHWKLSSRPVSKNSDHYPFVNKGVPAVFLYAMGGVPTWHTPKDTPDTLDPEVMEDIGRLVFWVLWDLANRENVEWLREQAPSQVAKPAK